MSGAIEAALKAALTDSSKVGQIAIRKTSDDGFVLYHCDDEGSEGLRVFCDPEEAIEIAKFDDAGRYRSLKTAPNLRRGWQLEVADLSGLRRAIDYFYPGRLAMFAASREKRLSTTPFRETLARQSGMYRVAAKITDAQADKLIGRFCRSDGGCLRTILWKRDAAGTLPSGQLPPEKYNPAHDQTLWPGSPTPATTGHCIPLLCQEACNLLVAEARKTVKMEGAAPSAP